MTRNLSPDETALWARVMASVRPLKAATVHRVVADQTGKPDPPQLTPKVKGRVPPVRPSHPPPIAVPLRANTLDGSWDRQLTRGAVLPDVTVDLHGHSLRSAHDLLDTALAGAIARGDRLVLLVTGRPPRPESERPHARGAIRAAVGDWLAASRHAAQIAAVRGAHPRHGGGGALYLVLRRSRDPKS